MAWAQEEECLEPVSAEALALAADVGKITEGDFSQKFCQAFAACTNFQMKASEVQQIKDMEEYYKKLPETIEKAKATITKLTEQLATLEVGSSEHSWKSQSLQTATAQLAELEEEKVKYDLHLSDPAKHPHPMKEKGIGLTPEEQVAFQEAQVLKMWESNFKMLVSTPAPTPKETLWAEIEVLSSASPVEWYSISQKYMEITMHAQATETYEEAQAYKNDPSTLPQLLKNKGIGVPPADLPAFQKSKMEKYYQGIPAAIADAERFLTLIDKKISDLTGSDQVATLQTLQQWKPYYEAEIAKMKESHAKYLSHKANPSADPNFLLAGGGMFGGFGGYGGYGGGYVGGSMGGMGGVYGSSGGSGGSCGEAESYHRSVVTTMERHKAGACGMTPEELAALNYYSASGYTCVNSYLRTDDNRDENIDYLISVLNRGLGKLPSYRGIVRRGASLPQSIRDAHAVGSVVEYDAFTSTSTASGFGGSDVFIIHSETGRPIMGFSGHDGEKEVLFQSGAKFKVLDVREENGTHVYVMAEVPKKGKMPTLASLVARASSEESTEWNSDSDSYMCPLDGAAIPRVLNQTHVPRFSLPEPPP